MNLLEMISGNSGVIGQIAGQLGISESEAKRGVGQLTPALSRAIQRNTTKEGGLESLLGALKQGNHAQYVDDPNLLGRAETLQDGNSILGHLFGSKDVSRNVAGHAAQKTGLDADILKKMLPMIAAAAMGSMSKQTQGSGILGALTGGGAQQPQQQASGILGKFLDADKDGSIADDLLGLAKKFF